MPKISFLPGATLPVYYNPTHPAEAFVNPKGITMEGVEVAWWLGVFTPLLGLLLLAKSFHPSPWSNESKTEKLKPRTVTMLYACPDTAWP